MRQDLISSNAALAAARGVGIFLVVIDHVDARLSALNNGYITHKAVFEALWYVPMPLFFYV